jgi:Signal transduction histidine kinase
MVDISNDIRRRMLERIFFHDVLNKAGNITGILDLLTAYQNNQLKSDELLGSLKVTANDLIEEILYQRDLSAAENNELKPKNEEFRSLEILSQIKQQIENSEIANGKVVVTDPVSVNLIFVTDGLLLRRVLLNMLKNALEAVNRSSTITIGCRHILPDRIQFWVHNNTVMPTEIQMQLFNKSFSTKEAGRGLGTYSIKLLGEKYLKGKVTFVSTNETGTIFCIELPVTPSAAPLNDQNS